MSHRLVQSVREGSPLERLQAGRVLVASLLLVLVTGAAAVRGVPFPLMPFVAIILAADVFSFASFLALRRMRGSSRFAAVQIAVDLVLETLLVYATGGAFSVFTFAYLLSVMTASRVLGPWQSLPTASAVVLLHGSLLLLLLYGLIPPVGDSLGRRDLQFEASVSLLVILGSMCAAFVVAYVSARLAERLRQMGQLARRVQADLTHMKVLHEDIVESVASGIVTLDHHGRLMTANRMAGTIAGVPPMQLLERSWEEVFSPPEPFDRVLADLRSGAGRARRLEARLLRPGGSVVSVGVSLALLSRGDLPVGVVCSFQDLTQIRKMEDQVRRADRLAAIGALAASLAHEIRNPLLAVAGSIEELERTLRPAGTDLQLMEIVLKESARLNALLFEFLEYSRVRPVHRQLGDVSSLLGELTHLLAYDPRTPAGVKIVAEASPPTLRATFDGKQLHQALWNLCVNAIEAMPQGGELRLAAAVHQSPGAEAGEPPAGLLVIRVHDTGPGIPAEHRPRIFEPFYSTKPRGFGLGLAIVHRIVEDHGGQIDVESDEGHGTTFVIALPLSEGEWTDG